jgi:MerR family copper efflux transcriptional regulator
MQIGEVADRVGLSLRTIRHYDEVGLVPPSARSEGGFRLYTEPDVARLALIMRMKPLGFTLDEMRALLATLDALDREGVPDKTQLQRLTGFCEAAHARVQALRDELAVATSFADTLTERQQQLTTGRPPPKRRSKQKR